MSNITFNEMDKKIYNAILKAYNETFPDENINDFQIQFQGNDDGTCVAIFVINYDKYDTKNSNPVIKIEEVWLDEDIRVLYAVSSNSISIIMNNAIKPNFDEFYCKVKDVLNVEFRNFEVGFNYFIESVDKLMYNLY